MKSKIIILLLVVFAFAGARLHAGETLSLSKARELALANSRSIQKTLLAVDSSLLAEKARGYTMLPQASLSLAGGLNYPTASDLASALAATASISVSQTIYDGGKNAILLAIDRLATKSAREEARAACLDVLESTDNAYYAVLEARAAVEAAKSDLSASRVHQSIAQAKFDSGVVIKSAVMEAQAETSAKETVLSLTARNLSVASAKLKSLTGTAEGPQGIDFLGYEALMKKISLLDDAAVEGLINRVYGTAAAENPALAISNLAVSKAQGEIAAAKTGYLPAAAATWSQSAAYSIPEGLDLVSKGSLSIGVTVPLDFAATKNAVQSKSIAASQAALDKEDAVSSLNLEIQSGIYDLMAAVRSVSSSQKALEYAESHYEVVLELYRLSRAS